MSVLTRATRRNIPEDGILHLFTLSPAKLKPSYGTLRRVALVRTDVLPKCRFLQEPHGVTSQKTAFFIATAVSDSWWHTQWMENEPADRQ
jgi:hypothetical protein